MNNACKVIWSHALQQMVVVSEIVCAHGKAKSTTTASEPSALNTGAMNSGAMNTAQDSSCLGTAKRLVSALALAFSVGVATPTLAQNSTQTPAPTTLPSGGSLAAGQASISSSGANMVINQATQRAAINWQSFNVGKDAHVHFNQSGSNASTLNRVHGTEASTILGRITAPGQVIISNGNGVFFGRGSMVDVGSLVATTHGISNERFMAGDLTFERNGSTASVVNDGELRAKLEGYIALIAPEVRNQGLIVATKGTVALAAGELVELLLDPNNKLTNIRVEASQWQALVDNRHAIEADGGLVILSAMAARELQGSVVNNSGTINASSLTEQGGRIILTGNHITLQDGSNLKATGATGGGQVLVGGDWQGGANAERRVFADPNALHQATTVTMEQGASIDASATENGKGGTVVLWSDLHHSGGFTRAQGSLLARGGTQGGDGGQVETSGFHLDVEGITVNASAPKGASGQWLLDPFDIVIGTTASGTAYSANFTALTTSYIRASDITASLNNSTSVSISTGSSTANTIFVNAAITATGGAASLTLTGGTLSLAANITTYGAHTYNGNLLLAANNLALTSNNSAVTVNGGILANDAARALTINAGSGQVTISGNVSDLSSLTVNTGHSASQIAGVISGATTLVKEGTGTLALTNANTYTGGTTLSAGTLGIYNNTAMGSGALTVSGDSNLLLGRSVTSIANHVTLDASLGISYDTTVEYLIVAGGGSGGSGRGGGGGAGGVLQGSTQLTDSSYSVAVGAGGASVADNKQGITGANSSVFGLTALGGGGGGGWNNGTTPLPGLNGGSGGGDTGLGGVNAGNGTLGQGYAGFSVSGTQDYGGGGGGAGAAATSKNGGVGIETFITGSSLWVGGGGGAGVLAGGPSAGTGGLGGGGAGSRLAGTAGTGGTANTGGGGGGGAGGGSSGAGGSGVVYVRYLGGTAGTGGNVTAGTGTATGYTIHSFTSTGSSTLALNPLATTLSGNISGTGSLVSNVGSGNALTLTGSNTYGNTTINSGTLNVGNGSTTGTLGTGTVENNAALVFNRSNALTVGGIISGAGTLTQSGTGTTTLTAANTYSGSSTINAGTLQIGDGGNAGTLGTGSVVNDSVLAFNRANDLTFSGNISGSGSLTQQGTGTLTLTQNNTYTGTNTIANGVLVLSNNAPNPTNKTFGGAGLLRIQPTGPSFTSDLLTEAWSFESSLSGLTLGKDGNTANITMGSLTSIAGPIELYGGNIAINAPLISTGTGSNASITLKGSGNVTDGPNGYVQSGAHGAGNLLLLGGNVTLDSITNNDVGTLAASGVSGLTYLDKAGLTVGTVGSTQGVSATGVVNIGTQSGSLTITQNVTTTNASSTALTLNASIGSAIGADFGSNLLVSGTPTISVGGGGVGRLYTGGISGSSALVGLSGLGSGTGRFRYNADETTVFSSPDWTPLSAGLNLIYRQQPVASVTVASKTMTYGDALPVLTGSVTGAVNGDSAGYVVSNRLDSTSGNIRAGSYTLTETGLAQLGYSVTVANSTLSVAQKALSLTGLLVNDKTYNRSTSAVVSSYGSLSGAVSGDAVSLVTSTASASFDNFNAGANKTVTLTGLSLTGTTSPAADDSANYTISNQTTTAAIHKASLTLAAVSNTKEYDRATTSTGTVNVTGLVAGDSITGTLSQSFDSKNVLGTNGSLLRVNTGYVISDGNAGNNYTVTTTTATGTITPKSLTLAGASGVSKTYDGTVSTFNLVLDGTSTSASAIGSLGGVVIGDSVSVSGAPVFASANVARGAGGAVTSQAIQQGTVELGGSDAGNYNLVWTNGSGTVMPAVLTLRANNEAKFVTQSDPTFTASYSGFVNGETHLTAGLIGTLSVNRSTSGPDGNPPGSRELAGIYTGAITATGVSANNYTITEVAGHFTIVGSDRLLVRASGASTYGTAAAYTIASASYWDPAANSGQGAEVQLSGITSNGSNSFTIADGADASATFTLGPLLPQTSTATQLRAGTYQLGTTGSVTENSGNFSDSLVVVGTHQVNQAALTPVVNTAAKTKSYDGTTTMSGLDLNLSSTGKLTDDLVTLNGSGAFVDKNVNRDGSLILTKGYTVSDIALGGADAGNYFLSATSLTGQDGKINPITLTVTYTGEDKVYNGSASATVTTGDNRIVGDSFSIQHTSNFVSTSGEGAKSVLWASNLVQNKNISITGVSLSGTDAGNYELASTIGTATAKITPASLVISGIVGVDKTYDKTTDAPLSLTGLSKTGLVADDDVTVTPTGVFADYNAGLGKTVTISSIYGGADVGNYTITGQTSTTATINKRQVSVAATGVVSKEYDGTTAMNGVSIGLTAVNGVAASGVIQGDTVEVSGTGSFSSADVSRDGNGQVLANKDYSIGNLQLSGASVTNYMIVGGATTINGSGGRIDPKTLTLTGFAAEDREYDGTNSATIAQLGSLVGLVGTDDVGIVNTGATFSGVNVGPDQTVTLNGVALNGAKGGNYSIANTATTTASIKRKTITITGLVANHRNYDGSTNATVSNWGVISTGVTGEALTLNHGTASFDNANAGTGKTVTATGYSLANGTGGLASNYQLASTSATTTADVGKAALSISTSNVSKTYDGGLAADGTAIVVSGTLFTNASNDNTQDSLSGGDFAFTDKNSGTGNKSVTVAGVTINDGNNGGNYSVTYVDNTSSTINKAALTVMGSSAADKTYNGNDSATITVGSLTGFVDSETVTATATGAFDSKNAGTRTATAVYALVDGDNGGLASNYQLANTTHTATIDKATLTVTGSSAADRTYNGNDSATITVGSLTGFVGSETVTATATGTFDSKNAGTRTATALYTLVNGDSGGLADNYQLANTTHTATINKVTLTVAGSTAANKTYNGNDSAAITVGSLTGFVDSETVTATATGTFDSKNVGTRTATAVYTLADGDNGGLADNYQLANTTHSATINKATLTVTGSTVADKVYDGNDSANITVSSLSGLVGSETLSVTAMGTFDSKNVGVRIATAVYALADGSNGGLASNYSLSSTSGTATASITRLSSVTWVGTSPGDWFDPSNWVASSNLASWQVNQDTSLTGAVPDLSNVEAVVIGSGQTVHFNDSGSGPPVNITALQGGGAKLVVSTGALNVGANGVSLSGYEQSGGAVSSSGHVTVSNNFSQTGGTLSTTGASDLTITQAVGDLAWKNVVAGRHLSVDVAGKISFGETTVGGDLNSTTRGAGVLGGVGQTGALSVAGTATFVAHTGTLQEADLTHAGNDFQKAVSLIGANGGNWKKVPLVDKSDLELGKIDTQDDFSAEAGKGGNGGKITQGADSTLDIGGDARFKADGDIILNGPDNDFKGTVNTDGQNITIKDKNDLKLGDTNARGDLTLAAGGNITQDTSGGKKIVVNYQTNLNAGGAIDLPGDNDFRGGVKVKGSRVAIKGVVKGDAAKAAASAAAATAVASGSGMFGGLPVVTASLGAAALGGAGKVSVSSSGGAPSAGVGGSSGIEVKVMDRPEVSQLGVVAVTLPPDTSTAGSGFVFALPAEVAQQLTQEVRVGLLDGTPLPDWLRFNPATGEFSATAVPDRAFPIQVSLTWGGQQLLVVISEKQSGS